MVSGRERERRGGGEGREGDDYEVEEERRRSVNRRIEKNTRAMK